MGSRFAHLVGVLLLTGVLLMEPSSSCAQPSTLNPQPFEGRYYRGRGDMEYLRLLDSARRMFAPDPEYLNMAMLYMPAWNGLVEGPTWDAWWIQNSYGTTYCALPFYTEPFVTFLQNSQDLWFDQMGDGKRKGAGPPFDWVAPDGALCDAARPGYIIYKQGDGNVGIHDWGMEFTAAGLLMQCELLLIGRDAAAVTRYLPKLERVAAFLESRRDPANDLFLAGPAGNLLAPSYAGWKRPDGTYDKAYLAGLSVTTIAALDRLIEVEKLAGRRDRAALYRQRRDAAKRGLARLTTPEGYLIRSLDPDGVRHGVYGAEKHGYFETSPNHDTVCFRVAGDAQAKRIMDRMAAIPGLRPHDFILPNYPSYDDMYEKPEGLWAYGTWVNGGHWSTCEARMVMAYYRTGRYEDARRSMRRLMDYARRFRMDNPLTKMGADVYQPNQPLNITYDAFGPPAAMVRGLFEYLYRADGLTLVPHIPPGIVEMEQRFPIRFGRKRLWLSSAGRGPVTAVRVNGRTWHRFDGRKVFLPYEETPDDARVQIALGGANLPRPADRGRQRVSAVTVNVSTTQEPLAGLSRRAERLARFGERLRAARLGESCEAAHAALAADAIRTAFEHTAMQARGALPSLPEETRKAAERLYVDSANRLYDGLDALLQGYEKSPDARRRKMAALWREAETEAK